MDMSPIYIRSGQNHLARHSERGKKTRQTEEEMRRQNQGIDRPGVRQVPEGSVEQRKMEETGCEVICGAPTTLAVKGQVKYEPKTEFEAFICLKSRLVHTHQCLSCLRLHNPHKDHWAR